MSGRVSIFQLIVLFVGLAISSASLWHDVTIMAGLQDGPSFCSLDGTFDCDAVTKSDYSSLFGVPVAAFAVFFYSTLFFFSLYFRLNGSGSQAWTTVSFFWSVVGIFTSLRLAYVSAFVLEKFCLYCAGLYIVAILFLVLSWRAIRDVGFATAFASGCKLSVSFWTLGLLPSYKPLRSGKAKLGLCAFLALLLFAYQSPLYVLQFTYPSASFVDGDTIEQAVAEWEAAPVQDVKVSHASATDERDFFHGPEFAPVTIVAFSDFECPFCRELSYVLKDLTERHPGDVKVVFKHFPLDHKCNPMIQGPFHKYACQASAMSLCAGIQSQDRFWQMHDLIYGIDDITQSELFSLPQIAEINVPAFHECMGSDMVKQKILNDIEQGMQLGIQGTPAVFLNGRRIERLSFQVLDAIILSIVKNKSSEVLG